MALDLRSTPVSTDHPLALEGYEQALRHLQTYVGDPIAAIDAALAEHPDFVLGHLFRAGALMTFGEQRFARDAAASVVAAEALGSRANARERGLTGALRALVDGDWDRACARLDDVLVEYPRDAFAIQVAHLFDFYRGDALNLRNRIARVLPAWSPNVPGYSYILGMYAFGLEECNQYAEAEAMARRALALERRDGWATHAAVHVCEMTGRIDDGVHLLESTTSDWAPDNGLAFHNWWHLALFRLDRGETARVLELYDDKIFPETIDMSLVLVDCSSLLWRLHLAGVDVRARMAAVAAVWNGKLESERGFYAFNDVHAVMTHVARGSDADAARAIEVMQSAKAPANARMTRDVGLPVARALRAFGAERYDEVIELLVPVRDIAHRFGGSHAQRDVITLTLVEAALRSGRAALARHVLAERTVTRPGSALGWRLAARTTGNGLLAIDRGPG